MKSPLLFLLCTFFLAASLDLAGQTPGEPAGCVDVVYLRDGSVYRGRIIEQPADGPLVLQTWNGLTLHLDAKKVRRVVQRCPEDQLVRADKTALPKPYNFRERGWYNATSLALLTGRTWWDEYAIGYSLHNSTGYAFCRPIAVGLGVGVDLFLPYNDDVSQATYPLYAEARGYLLAKKVTPFYAVGAGWGFASGASDRRGYEDRWRGGWMGRIQVGYRLGNNFTLHGGLRWQRQTRIWTADGDLSHGQDQILHQRFELGFGLLL